MCMDMLVCVWIYCYVCVYASMCMDMLAGVWIRCHECINACMCMDMLICVWLCWQVYRRAGYAGVCVYAVYAHINVFMLVCVCIY